MGFAFSEMHETKNYYVVLFRDSHEWTQNSRDFIRLVGINAHSQMTHDRVNHDEPGLMCADGMLQIFYVIERKHLAVLVALHQYPLRVSPRLIKTPTCILDVVFIGKKDAAHRSQLCAENLTASGQASKDGECD